MQIEALNDGHDFGDSMLEEIRRTAERRLHEIEPLLEEAERLRDILQVIEGRAPRKSEANTADESALERALTRSVGDASGLRKLHDHRPQQAARASGGSEERAAKGSNKRAILALVADRPGITAAEISVTTGMKRTVVASTVSRLKRYGELIEHKSGGVCVPASPRQATADASNAPGRATRPRRPRLNAVQTRRAA